MLVRLNLISNIAVKGGFISYNAQVYLRNSEISHIKDENNIIGRVSSFRTETYFVPGLLPLVILFLILTSGRRQAQIITDNASNIKIDCISLVWGILNPKEFSNCIILVQSYGNFVGWAKFAY